MSNGRRWSVSLARKFTATAVAFFAFFLICFGAGMASWGVATLGFALVALAVSIVVISAVRGNVRSFVRGTAHVLDATDPPSNTPFGRCELQIVVEAPELAPAKVKIRDTRVPVAKWPDTGDTLPIRVAIEDPRHVRILWDEVRTHGEEAAEEERFNEYVQRILDAELSGSAGAAAGVAANNGDTLPEGAIPPVTDDGPPPEPAPVPRQKPSPRPRRPARGGGATGGGTTGGGTAGAALAGTVSAAAATALAPPPAGTEPGQSPGSSTDSTGLAGSTGRGEAAAPAPAPSPTPAPRPAAEPAGGEQAAGDPAHTQPAAEPTGPERDHPDEEDEAPVHDVVPIEGASAVLGVPPRAAADQTSPAEADAEAVRDLLAAPPAARFQQGGPIHGVSVTLIVTDLDRSIDFYRDKLGFQVLDSGPSSAVLASGDTRLMLRCVPDMPRVDRRVVHLNLEVGDVEAVYTELMAKGVRFIHRPQTVARGKHMELWAAAFRDPDGHGIALIKWQQT